MACKELLGRDQRQVELFVLLRSGPQPGGAASTADAIEFTGSVPIVSAVTNPASASILAPYVGESATVQQDLSLYSGTCSDGSIRFTGYAANPNTWANTPGTYSYDVTWRCQSGASMLAGDWGQQMEVIAWTSDSGGMRRRI
ncbi:MAG: hypothetical protein ACYDAY_07715 [Candidatus Dormibacteria bacterium]